MSEQIIITFKELTKEQRELVFQAERELSKAGISFDTGSGCNGRDWYFDWSLKGNVQIRKAKHKTKPIKHADHCTLG